MATTFWYTHPDVSAEKGRQPETFTLSLPSSPYSVNWNYNLNTQTYDTYGGQVVQVLSVNIDQLVIEGQLGREGAFGIYKKRGGTDDRYGGPVPNPGWSTHDHNDQANYRGSDVRPGLYAMLEFFRTYFALVSQGGDSTVGGKYLQIPMFLTYDGATSDTTGLFDAGDNSFDHATGAWMITPTSFPNFKRSNQDFAPQWRIEAQVIEAPKAIQVREKEAALARLQEAVGYTVRNPFSDPTADPTSSASQDSLAIANKFQALIPQFSLGELQDMIWRQISSPSLPPFKGQALTPDNYLTGEVGIDDSQMGDAQGSSQNPPPKPPSNIED